MFVMLTQYNFTAVNLGFEAAAEPGLDARPSINTRMQKNKQTKNT